MIDFPRDIFNEDHNFFRDNVRKFFENEMLPHNDEWEEAGQISREAWLSAGENCLLCVSMPEEFGGSGVDFSFEAIIIEEQMRLGMSGPGFYLHSCVVAPYLNHYGTREQKAKWLPKMASGEVITAIAMTEPDVGSDLASVKTTAVKDGDDYVLNGSKTFITNGQMADLVIVVAKTDTSAGAKGVSLFLVESDRDGFSRGKNLKKIGMKAQDTSELFFDNVRIPKENLLGVENKGFMQLMTELAQERLAVAVGGVAYARAAYEWTVEYVKDRKAFGQRIADFQNTRFKLAEVKTQIEAAQAMTDRAIKLHISGDLDGTGAAMVKIFTTEMQGKVTDECLQLFGGNGYMWEYPIAKAYADARVQRIYGGTTEIMKEIISREIFNS